jgi:mannan endo-1,4-beta-mannosidase
MQSTRKSFGLLISKYNVIGILIFLFSFSLPQQSVKAQDNKFVSVVDGHFMKAGQPYKYVGANFWYGAILASEGRGGNRTRLKAELDSMCALGIDNLRILVGADGKEGAPVKVRPSLQQAPGVYNDTILAGLDYLLSEMGKRKMVAVLYLNNSWEWSGGYGYYLEMAGEGKSPLPSVDGYNTYVNFVSRFATNSKAQQFFIDYVRFILGRTNRYTHQRYIDDPAIMAWQICNEPRAFSAAAKEPFAAWIHKVSSIIKSLDGNHLVSTGSEGFFGCESDMALFERIHADTNIDYLNIHIWPYNWQWARADYLTDDLPQACNNAKFYIDMHLATARKLNKPLVIEEFGYPRNGAQTDKKSGTTARDIFYRFILQQLTDNALIGGPLEGCNFWAWGGSASHFHKQWIPGDDYTGDPAQEPQGLNSVWQTDHSTLDVISDAIKMLHQ